MAELNLPANICIKFPNGKDKQAHALSDHHPTGEHFLVRALEPPPRLHGYAGLSVNVGGLSRRRCLSGSRLAGESVEAGQGRHMLASGACLSASLVHSFLSAQDNKQEP